MKVLEDSSFLGDGDSQWPPGFRFHPTDEELVLYYLKKKICRQRRKLDIIGEVDVYKWDPEELPGISRLKSGDRQWFFFSPRDRKYPNGGRANRATRHGYWKATGKDRTIASKSRSVGIKKTLVFYKGRAPTGVRTDWVMHEYTLHEEELKRCPTAQDYYALYKVYKKSGPGPKNGEQYGAPFREEDWADDENVIVEGIADQETSLKQANEFVLVDDTATNGQVHSQIDDLQSFMNQIANDSLFEPLSVAYDMQQVACGDEETHSTLVDQSLLQGTVQERSMVILPSGQDNVQASFDPTQSATSHFQHNETSEVTSAPNMNRQGSRDSEKDLLEDFLEMDDLIGPEPTVQNMEKPVDNLSFEGMNGLGELDLFQDLAMFLNDTGPIDPQPVSHTYFNKDNDFGTSVPSSCPSNLENGVVDPNSCSYFNSFETEVVQTISQTYHNNLDNEMLSQFDYQLPYHSDEGNQLWMHNQNFNITTPAESNPGAVIPPTSGVIYAGENQNQFQNQNLNHNQSGKEGNVGDSWFSSALWTFVESIPTTPASASESTALMNKAFERLSSFGRISDKVKLSTVHTNANAGNPTATRRRSGNRFNRGLLIFSALGVLCAILWVLTGTSIMRVLGRCLS